MTRWKTDPTDIQRQETYKRMRKDIIEALNGLGIACISMMSQEDILGTHRSRNDGGIGYDRKDSQWI